MITLELTKQFFLKYGPVGLFIQSFLSSTIFFPGYTEIIIPLYVSLFETNLVFIVATVGSILGGMFNYGLGLLGSKFIKSRKEITEKAKKWLDMWGDLSVFITSFVPGFPFDVVAIAVGIFRMNFKVFMIAMSLGKILKHAIIIYGTGLFLKIFLGI